MPHQEVKVPCSASAVPPTQVLEPELTPAETSSSQWDDTELLQQRFVQFGLMPLAEGEPDPRAIGWRWSLSDDKEDAQEEGRLEGGSARDIRVGVG